jgi:hypothetical protein
MNKLALLWTLSMCAVGGLGVAIGLYLARDQYVAAIQGNQIIARFDQASRAWLEQQTAPEPVRRRGPGAEAHIVHLHAVIAITIDGLRTRRQSGPATLEGWTATAKRLFLGAPDNRLALPGTFADLLPGNAYHDVRLP